MANQIIVSPVVQQVTVTPDVYEVGLTTPGPQGIQGIQGVKGDPGDTGPSGVVAVDGTYITNSGTSTSANLSFVPSALTIAQSQVTGLVSALAGKAALSASNTFTIGEQVIATGAVGNRGLVIKPVTGQTALNIDVRNTSDTGTVFSVDATGNTRTGAVINTTTFNNSRIQMLSSGTVIDTQISTNKPLRVIGASGQSANLQEWENGGVVQSSIGAFGNATFATAGTVYGRLSVGTGTATTIGAVIRGAASQSANLQEWQNSAGSILGKVASDGTITGAALSTTNTLIQDLGIRFTVTTTPTAPGSTRGRLYFKAGTTGLALFAMGPTGTEVRIADNLT